MIDSSSKWKILSFALMGILATGLVAPQGYADVTSGVLYIVTNIQSKVNNLQTSVSNLQTSVNNLSSGNGASLTNLQSNVTAIKTKTDNLPIDPASNSHIDSAIASIPAGITQAQYQTLKCNSAIIRAEADLSNCNYEWVVIQNSDLLGANLQGTDFSHANLEGTNFNGANLQGTNFNEAAIDGASFTGCTGTPVGTPSLGTLPTCS